jgi:hypothetical protein
MKKAKKNHNIKMISDAPTHVSAQIELLMLVGKIYYSSIKISLVKVLVLNFTNTIHYKPHKRGERVVKNMQGSKTLNYL